MRVLGVLLLGVGCTAAEVDEQDVDTEVEAPAGPVTYHEDVRPILERACMDCHQTGGIGPLDFTWRADEWADGPPAWVQAAAAAVAAGTMPPWMPDEDCHPIAGSRSLSEREKSRIAAWAAADFPEGLPAAYRGPRTVPTEADLGPADAVLEMPVPYTADLASPDDYRCFVVQQDVADTTWLRGVTVRPGAVDVVHHVLLYRLDASWADDVATWESEDEAPGYTCFGSPGTWEAETIVGWAPGQLPEIYAEGVGRRIAPGSILVMQLHYNTVNLRPGEAAPADRSAVELWTLPERPTFEILSLPLAQTDLEIPAGAPDVEQTLDFGLDDFLRRSVPIRGAFPHMHRLGTSIRVDVLREDGSEECVISVPAWDFDWQQTYFYPENDPIFVSRYDELRLTCRYDNSAANQVVVNGEQIEPRDVGWGEGTFDEMCLAYLYVTLPTTE